MRPRSSISLLTSILVSASCTGTLVSSGEGAKGIQGSLAKSNSDPLPGRELAARSSGLRRLTSDEYDNTLRDLLGDDTRASNLILPEDARSPFDNDYTEQKVSAALIEGVELLARDASKRLLADAARRDKVVGCRPTGPGDSRCFSRFITTFGRRALRRPPDAERIRRYQGLQALAAKDGDFYAAVDAAIRLFLQDGEFLYRIETGTPVPRTPGLLRLDAWTLASRLSYFLWGTMPSDALLDRAANGQLDTPGAIRAAAAEMLGDPRARQRIGRFHALWLGYDRLPHAAQLSAAMQAETDALLGRIIFEQKRPWQDLFRSTETFVSDLLAKHYELPLPGSKEPVWVSYGASRRRGLLSHGSFLSLGGKFGDTSPTRRGKAIRERLFCEEIGPPPEGVDVDSRPRAEESPCKWERYQEHRRGGCRFCHGLMDPIGFGLENYDAKGRYRTVIKEEDQSTGKKVDCPIRAEGRVDEQRFSGPIELEDIMLGSGSALTECLVTQLHRFAFGRFATDEIDQKFIATMTKRLGDRDFRFDELVLDFVSAPAFAYRRVVD